MTQPTLINEPIKDITSGYWEIPKKEERNEEKREKKVAIVSKRMKKKVAKRYFFSMTEEISSEKLCANIVSQ